MARQVRDWDEQDAYTGWRHVIRWKRGEIKAIKRRTHKRERRAARDDVRAAALELLDESNEL